ncbi:hypothetical protein [Aeromicrobium chenweiae]|uniref:Uncharacterized protein n=1 Tax=Aeromicrobium chenweiae TaxID=2079793 RepID=A0A2S0WNC6_9ACTN|nr:hypothetical protein [Aeromicrobium chenweiae]AWB92848.1 hypothetical protein C3E78_11890 [Aeromicrobium chenweiae]TGN33842.1 hypothetical protein E4L97_01940 [Aeromicrobium chenweiae]
MDEPEVVSSVSRWEWDRSEETVTRVLGRAKTVTWASAAGFSVVLVSTGWVLATGILRESAVIYGVLGGVLCGYLVRAAYVGAGVRRAVAPVKAAIVPAAVQRASEAQLVSLVVNGGSMFDPYVLLRAVPGDALVEITGEDLAARDMPRPGFWQLLMTGPDGTYYDDGSGTMARPADHVSGDFGGGDIGGGGDVGGSP